MELILNFFSSNETQSLQIKALIVALVFTFFSKVISNILLFIFSKITYKTKTKADDLILKAFQKPLQWLVVIFGLHFSLGIIPFSNETQNVMTHIFRSSIVILIGWGLLNLSAKSSHLFNFLHQKTDINIDKILIPFLSRAIQFTIFAFIFAIIAEEWGYDVNGFVAGLGIGGLAIAFAAKDTLSNLLSGLILIVEKPFSIGDWVKIEKTEGTVEDINLRSTRIRTFSQALVNVPNGQVANAHITNFTKMEKRRITFNLGLTYDTPRTKIEKSVSEIKLFLLENKNIHQETIFVHFNEFNNSSLDVFLYFFTNTTDWGEYLKVREEVNLKILEILEKNNVSIAFPSRTLYIEQNRTT